jgi:predicted DNA-binding protein
LDYGITIYGEMTKEYSHESTEGYIVSQLNGFPSERKEFIETKFLEEAGFRRTGNIRYRKSNGSEKSLSVLHGIFHAVSQGIIPMKPFFEIEYAELPKGEYYKFEQIILTSNYRTILPEVLIILELEYKLQIEFCNGTLIENNKKYYTEESIRYFEELIKKLPEIPESINKLKERYVKTELPKIKSALERYNNPTEDYIRARENLKEIYNMGKNRIR